MGKNLEWQIEYAKFVASISNKDLLDETLHLAGGDDHDGCFTLHGEWQYNYLLMSLKDRLGDWLKDGDFATINKENEKNGIKIKGGLTYTTK